MTVLSVSRINQQKLQAVQVALGDSGQVAGEIACLLAALTAKGLYNTESLTDAIYPGGWRIKFARKNFVDQFAYPGDWILVTDATYTDQNGWVLADTSLVHVYGTSSGLAGTPTDFVNTFTDNTGLVWAASAAAPTATSNDDGTVTLAFPQPTSANGPFTYSATGPGTIGSFVTDAKGNVTTTITDLIGATLGPWTVECDTQYSGVNATSMPSNTVTAAAS